MSVFASASIAEKRLKELVEKLRRVLREELGVYIIARDYDLLVLDLGVERSDELIATNVITLSIISATSGATYSIKLFSTDKPALSQDILPPSTTIERLNRANVYLSNPAQAGASLKILVFKG